MVEPLLLQARYRSKLEVQIGEQLNAAGIPFVYEGERVPFTVPARQAKYWPDFRVGNIIIEGKGYFVHGARDRQKLILVRDSHPDLDIRLVFSDANKPIYKGSPTTYGEWAADHGFKWSTKGIVPKDWIEDLKNASGAKSTNKQDTSLNTPRRRNAGTGQRK